MRSELPSVSIIILNYNGQAHLPDCLASVAALEYPPERREVVVVDNGSTDGSPAWVREHDPGVRVVELGANLGFAEGNNRGAALARGEILAFLNTDTRVDPRWLSELVAALQADASVGAVASRMLDWEGTAVDFPVYATSLGMPYASSGARRFRRPDDYDRPHPLLFASGGGMAIRREVFLGAGGFDADFFMYHEDLDLGWRLWLFGHRVEFVPAALVYHRLGGSHRGDPAPLYFLNERNALYTVIKNAGDPWLARLLPVLLLWLLERIGGYLRVDPASFTPGSAAVADAAPTLLPAGAGAALAAAMDLIRHLPQLLAKRAAIQAQRVRSDAEIATLLDLPADAFVQMMLDADLDFREAAGLIDIFGLDPGEGSLFGRRLRALDQAEALHSAPLRDAFLYLANHEPADADAAFGEGTVARLVERTGLAARDLQVLARVLVVAGSRLLAAIGPSGLSDRGAPDAAAPEVVRLMKERLWRDLVFYREELSKRTDQLFRVMSQHREQANRGLSEQQEQLRRMLDREAAWDQARRTLEATVDGLVRDRAALEAERERLAAALQDQERRSAAVMEAHEQRSTTALQAHEERSTTALQDHERQIEEWRRREAELAGILRSKRYRLGEFLAVSWWWVRHPRDVAARVRNQVWQFGRTALSPSAKRWVKRAILRRRADAWGTPVGEDRAAGSPAVVPDRPASPGSSVPPAITHGTRLPRRSKYDLIMFSPIDWDFRYQRPQQLASQFAEDGHRVFYVSITFMEPSAPRQGPGAQLVEVRPHVYEVRLTAPHDLTVYRSRLGGEALEWFAEAVARLRDEQGVVDAVSIVQLPFWRPLAIRLRERFGWAIVYDCLDRHSGFSTNDPAMLHEEEGLVRASDLVVATAARLFEEHRATNPRCILVPNAADFSHFSAFVGEPAAWLQQLRRPVIGYHGAIAEWFDTALVGELARLRPQWTFVLVGSTFTADLGPLQGLANVHLPGEQPYARLPAFLHSFDVCLIPFKRNPLTEATNPVKFYEYMSAGKPVVSATLPELDPYAREGLVAFADGAADFAAQIERAIETDSPAEAGRRRSFAEQNTWHDRYMQFSDAIQDAHPLASIVIPTHNNLHLTRLCLEGIFRNTSWPHVEIVVVDNASSDGTPAYLGDLAARHESVRCIFNERNEGFARANNQGIAASQGDYVVLLNNDTIVTRGWLSTMIRFAQAHPDVGMIGPATNLAGNEAKINVEYTNLAEMEAFAEEYTRAHAGEILEPAMLGFFCVLIPRRVLDEVGLLDERFGIGMFEDDDLSLRVRRAGYRLVCTDGAFVHHFHSATMRRLSEEEYLTLFEANREKYEQKWNIRWAPHRYRWQR